jgi:hypothetical protein
MFVSKLHAFGPSELTLYVRPIATNGGRGCAVPGMMKWHYAIIYTGKEPPAPRPQELPSVGEYGMMESVRVKQKVKTQKLDEMCRINFAKMYTFEHNVKVLDFGNVSEDSLLTLLSQWRYVLDLNTDAIASASYVTAPHISALC